MMLEDIEMDGKSLLPDNVWKYIKGGGGPAFDPVHHLTGLLEDDDEVVYKAATTALTAIGVAQIAYAKAVTEAANEAYNVIMTHKMSPLGTSPGV